MKNIDIKAFRKANNLTQSQLGEYLGCTKAFVSAIELGNRPIPDEMYTKLIDNSLDWDTSMLVESESPAIENQSAGNAFVDYLQQQIKDKDILIKELCQKVGMLEAKLELARKGEIAPIVVGSSDAGVV